MEQNKYEKMSDEQLLEEKNKIKTNKIFIALVIGLSFGVFVYAAVKNGMSFFTFLPLLFAYFAMKSQEKLNALEAVLNKRGLE